MYKCTILAVSLVIGTALAPKQTWADGECAKMQNVEERLQCIELKADFMHQNIGNVLKNKKIISSTRPGQCLTWVDNAAPPRTVPCGQPDDKWNLE